MSYSIAGAKFHYTVYTDTGYIRHHQRTSSQQFYNK